MGGKREDGKVPEIERREVFMSDRIRVTEKMVTSLGAESVLETGPGDYSFDYLRGEGTSRWVKADFSGPCDVVCDFNAEELRLPFGDGEFQLVVCTEVLEHLLWPQSLLGEILRVLKPDGRLVVSVPNISSLSYRVAWLIGRIPSCAAGGNLPAEIGSTAYRREEGGLVGGHVIDFNLRRLTGLLGIAGFAVVRVAGSGIIWHRQIVPHRLVPVSLSSNIICLAKKRV